MLGCLPQCTIAYELLALPTPYLLGGGGPWGLAAALAPPPCQPHPLAASPPLHPGLGTDLFELQTPGFSFLPKQRRAG